MNWAAIKIVIVWMLILVSFELKADFYQAQKAYQSKDYQQSFNQFKQLAEQGNANAQIALAQSYANGQGVEHNYAKALAWSMMAKQLQHPAADGLYLAYRDKVSSRREVKAQFKQLQQQFGLEVLQQKLYPVLTNPKKPIVAKPSLLEHVEPQFPADAYEDKTHSWVMLQYDIDANGHTTNIEVLSSYPDNRLHQEAIKAVQQWRFQLPLDITNKPKTYPLQTQVFELFANQNPYQNSQSAQQLLSLANQGSGEHQYQLAHLLNNGIIKQPHSKQQAPHQALDWLTRAAVNQYGLAQLQLYLCFGLGRCESDNTKAQLWLQRALKNQVNQAAMVQIANLISQGQQLKAIKLLEPLMKNNHLDALTLYANLTATSDDQNLIDYQQSIKIARQALALDHDNPRLLAIIALAHFNLDPNAVEQSQNQPKWQYLLSNAIAEAEYRNWPIDYYVNTLEKLQQQTLLQQIQQEQAAKSAKNLQKSADKS